MMSVLRGVIMELEDCAWTNLASITATDDPLAAFNNCDVAVLVGAMPRKEGMERKDLLKANAGIFKVQGEALDQAARKNVKVIYKNIYLHIIYLFIFHFRSWWSVIPLIQTLT